MVIRFSIPLLLAAALGCPAQTPSQPAAPCPAPAKAGQTRTDSDAASKTQDKASATCSTQTPKEPSAGERFPFPGESPAPAMPGASSATPDGPAPVQQQHRPTAAEEHPFPDSAPPTPGAESSSSSSSSNDDAGAASDNNAPDTTHPPLDDKGDNPRANARRRLPKVEKLQSDEERATEDIDIAKFYEDSGDLNAAYLRARDAVKSQPSDPEAHFTLARIAQKMSKRGEAIAEYNAYLKLEPDSDRTKQVQKALSQLKH